MASYHQFRLVPDSEAKTLTDDWDEVSDAKERRKRQNRVNQRKRRQKLVRQRLGEVPGSKDIIQQQGIVGTLQASSPLPVSQAGRAWFPLTPDHRLLHVIALNVTRGILTNYHIISLSLNGSTFSCSAGYLLDGAKDSLPISLHPTALQGQISHFGWIDLLPSAPLRNNLITAFKSGKLDEDEFLNDLVGGLFANIGCSDGVSSGDLAETSTSAAATDGNGTVGNTEMGSESKSQADLKPWDGQLGLVSWSDPWDIAGWEITDSFARKWSFLLRGCPDVIEATNKWRISRDEPCLSMS